MRIASLQKQSFIDWSGKVVAVIFTKGCNFRCGFCHNPELVLPHLLEETPNIPEGNILDYLSSRRNWLDGLAITGGEPTLQKDLPKFIASVKELGFLIKLDTNGTNPKMVEYLLENKLVDCIAMDIKTILEPLKFNDIIGVRNSTYLNPIFETIHLLRNSGIEYQLRTTIVPKYHNFNIKSKLLETFKNDPYVLQDYREANTIENEMSKID